VKSFKHLNMITFKYFNKYFCGALVVACCLFGGVGVVEGVYDISGECVEMNIPAGVGTISPEDICRAAGYGHCLEASGSFFTCTTGTCGTCGGAVAGTTCNGKNWWVIQATHTSAARVGHLICNVRTWGMIPKPSNVPGDFEQSIKNATDWILGFVGMIAVLMLIWGGINYLTSAGDEDKAKTGKKTISYALIGLVLAGIAYAVVNVIITVIL